MEQDSEVRIHKWSEDSEIIPHSEMECYFLREVKIQRSRLKDALGLQPIQISLTWRKSFWLYSFYSIT